MSIDTFKKFCKFCNELFKPKDNEDYCPRCIRHKEDFDKIRHAGEDQDGW